MTEYYKSTISFLIIFSWTAVMAEEGTQVDKRILLDAGDVHQSQIQFLNAQVSQLQQENNALKLQISQGSSNQEVQTLTSKVASLDRELPL